MKKKQKGFTLVELIVVIAIIGILAAIIAPNLVKYIKDSKLTTANANAKTVYTAAESFAASCATSATEIAEGNYYGVVDGATTITADPDKGEDHLVYAISAALGKKADKAAWGVEISSKGFPETAYYGKTDADIYVGMHPTAAKNTTENGFAEVRTPDWIEVKVAD